MEEFGGGRPSSLFQNLDKSRERFMRHAKIVEYEKGEVICVAGGDKLAVRYFSSGCAQISLSNNNREEVIGPIFRGTTANFVDMLEGRNQHSIKAMAKTIIYEIGPAEFDELCQDPMFLRWALRNTTRNVVLVAEYAAMRAIPNADDRILHFLRIIHYQQSGGMPEGDFEIEWPLTQQVFASMINVSRPYLNERFKALEAAGKLVFHGNNFSVRQSNWSKDT